MRNLMKSAVLAPLLGLACAVSYAQSTVPTEANPESMTVSQLETAGDLARIHKDYEQAIRYFQAALRKDRKNFAIYNKLGLAQMHKDQLKPARVSFERAVKYNPKFADAINNMGAIDYMDKRYGSAAKYFKRAVALDETRPAYHVNLGAAWFAQKKFEGAVTEYTRALELDPDALTEQSRTGITAQIASPEERAQWSYMMAKIYAQRGDIDGCLMCLRKAKEDGYRDIARVYKDEEFSKLRADARLHEIVPPPIETK